MRIPYVSTPPPTASPEEAAIVNRIQTRRGSDGLLELDLALLHAPHIADGWNSYMGAIRTKTSLSADVRELIILRVAVVNKAWYEWDQHRPYAVEGGIDQAALDEIKTEVLNGEQRPTALTERQWIALLYTDEMTRNIRVKDEIFDKVKREFNDREIVEITSTAAAYNCVSRFLVALDVGERNGLDAKDVS